jgi:hypothetical protein
MRYVSRFYTVPAVFDVEALRELGTIANGGTLYQGMLSYDIVRSWKAEGKLPVGVFGYWTDPDDGAAFLEASSVLEVVHFGAEQQKALRGVILDHAGRIGERTVLEVVHEANVHLLDVVEHERKVIA